MAGVLARMWARLVEDRAAADARRVALRTTVAVAASGLALGGTALPPLWLIAGCWLVARTSQTRHARRSVHNPCDVYAGAAKSAARPNLGA